MKQTMEPIHEVFPTLVRVVQRMGPRESTGTNSREHPSPQRDGGKLSSDAEHPGPQNPADKKKEDEHTSEPKPDKPDQSKENPE